MRFSNASQPLSNGGKDEWKTNMAATVALQWNLNVSELKHNEDTKSLQEEYWTDSNEGA